MRFSDIINLIAVKIGLVNEHGFASKSTEQSRAVFGNIKSVRSSEFYKTYEIGIEAKYVIEMRFIDYQDEQLAEIDGKRYKVLRSYRSKSGEYIELTLSDLSERGAVDGDYDG